MAHLEELSHNFFVQENHTSKDVTLWAEILAWDLPNRKQEC
jgi:hypothetical protein